LAALLHGTLVVGVSQTAAFNRGRHLYSAGRPSGWALAHISSFCFFECVIDNVCGCLSLELAMMKVMPYDPSHEEVYNAFIMKT